MTAPPRPVEVLVRRARQRDDALPLPSYESDGAAGLDLRADIDQTVAIDPGCRALIPTGLVIELPYGYEAQIRPRSGLALRHGVTLLNAPGTVDADYRGEIQVILVNLGEELFEVRRGDRIAQMVVAPVSRVSWQEQQSLSVTKRGSGGFGHTGRNLREPREN